MIPRHLARLFEALASGAITPDAAAKEMEAHQGFADTGGFAHVDLHRRDLDRSRPLIDVMFFISFFPHLVAGPVGNSAQQSATGYYGYQDWTVIAAWFH